MEPLDNALNDLFMMEQEPPLRCREVGDADVFEAARAGDVDRLRFLLHEERVDVNARDCWDCVPLYYSSRAGHWDAARGTRPARHQPLVAALRDAFSSGPPRVGGNDRVVLDAPGFLPVRCVASKMFRNYADDWNPPPVQVRRRALRPSFAFGVNLAGCSRLFSHRAGNAWEEMRQKHLRRNLPFFEFFSLLHHLYTTMQVCKDTNAGRRAKRLAFVDKRKDGDDLAWVYAQHRDLPPDQSRLVAAMRKIFHITLAKSLSKRPRAQCRGGLEMQTRKPTSPLSFRRPLAQLRKCDYADVCFLVDGMIFRGHKFILEARSHYFEARFRGATAEEEGSGSTEELPVFEENEIRCTAFCKLLEFVYTDTLEDEVDPGEAEEILDAASRYLMFDLKCLVGDALLLRLDDATPADLCCWLVMAEKYELRKLRDRCLDVMVMNFKQFVSTAEFKTMVASLPPPSGESCTRTSAIGGKHPGNVLDDFRERWLALEGEELDKRDAIGVHFDRMLEQARSPENGAKGEETASNNL